MLVTLNDITRSSLKTRKQSDLTSNCLELTSLFI